MADYTILEIPPGAPGGARGSIQIGIPGLRGPSGSPSCLRFPFSAPASASSAPLKIGIIPSGALVRDVVVRISEAFGEGASTVSIEIGDPDNPALLMDAAGNAPDYVHDYSAECNEYFAVATDIYLRIITESTPATGAGEAVIYYSAI